MRRLRARVFTLAAATVVLTASVASATWGNGAISKNDTKVAGTCGDLNGWVGACWGGFSSGGGGSSALTTSGDVGVQWLVGEEPDSGAQAPAPQPKTNYVLHQYTYVSGTVPFTLSINVTTSNSYGGTAGPKDSSKPSHWIWTGTVDQDDPEIAWWSPTTGWTAAYSVPAAWVTADTNGGQTGGCVVGGTVVAVGGSGTFTASGTATPPGDGNKVQVSLQLRSEATDASALNCKILTENYLKLHFTFDTSV